MTPEGAAEVLIQDLRAHVLGQAERFTGFIATGQVELTHNPFTGKQEPRYVSEALRKLAAMVADRRLNQNSAFLGVLRDVLIDMAIGPLFHLFAALDGEGAVGDPPVQLELRLVDGEPLPTYLHEILLPIEPKDTVD